jgi:O-antigen ligase
MAEYLQRHVLVTLVPAAAAASLVAGVALARGGPLTQLAFMGLFGLAGLWLLVSIPPQTLFLGWLFLAPLLQNGADGSATGAPLAVALYAVPGVMMAVYTLAHREGARLRPVELLPAAYLAYVLAVMLATSDALQSTPRFTFTTALLGPVVFYFLRIGPGAGIAAERIVVTLMYAAIVQGAMSVVDITTGWNLWHETAWQEGPHANFPRAVATLSNPAVLGTLLGVAIVTAVAALTWNGPRALRRPALATLAICIPGLLATLTRGPILATILGVVCVLAFSRWRTKLLAAIAVLTIVFVATLPTLRASTLYQDRVASSENITTREALQDWSLQLAAERPVFGWGYASFDEAKNSAQFDVRGTNIDLVLDFTSHNTYLTMLVELGGIGLLLFASPFVALAVAGVLQARRPTEDRWLIVASVVSLGVVALSAMTFDLRFFSFAQVLTWVLLALLARPRADAHP